ncbi:single-pass membrane and coiled-coil domain-containing protein 1-like [Hypanus sabinus]|uniref:single-pass membrane and coiled-coil domain-containing protein 1-like n=1 Tax=Hypanus sabinus TaxID=79690 RepID=UPI0028C4D07B|nr:single-pass membrane and coiled-coil domain-containing protein 1-like [Hypanus sabinus]
MKRWATKTERKGMKVEKQDGPTKSQESKASSERVSMDLLRHRIGRLEKTIEELTLQYQKLDQNAKTLVQSFDPHCANIAEQTGQDEMWSMLLEERFTQLEINLFFSYVVDMLQSLHSRVLEKQPESASVLPTLSSILKRKVWDRELEATWTSVLSELGLTDSDEKALCTFFVTYYNEAEYYPPPARKKYNQNIQEVLNKVVSSHILHHCLLHIVQLSDKENDTVATGSH